MSDLETLAKKYRELDEAEKKAKKEKEGLRPQFLMLMSEGVRTEREPDRESLTITAADLEPFGGDVRSWAAKHYPTFHVDAYRTDDGDVYSVQLEENMDLARYEFEVDGYRFGRNLSMVGATFEAEEYLDALRADKFDVEDDVYQALLDCVKVTQRTETDYLFDEEKAVVLMSEHPETLAIFQQFSFAGKPQVSLLPVKKANDA